MLKIFYFIMYNAHMSICLNFTMIFGKKKIIFLSQESIIASLFIIKAILNPFSATFHVIIFNVKKCALYSIKYGSLLHSTLLLFDKSRVIFATLVGSIHKLRSKWTILALALRFCKAKLAHFPLQTSSASFLST